MSTASTQNRKVVMALGALLIGMATLTFYSKELYNAFCRVTGYGGTTQRVELVDAQVIDREMNVRFVANTHRDMPWDFEPQQISQKLKIGAQGLAFYEAYNPTDYTIVGRATYNVVPHKAGSYFSKVDCFCFTEQILKPGERVDMPVVYYIDPEIDQDINLNEVTEVTLSYTFFILDDEETAEVLAGR